jgi:signal transduction histidine kinase
MISVLLVDDDHDLLEVTKLHLERSGSISVDPCQSAQDALSALTKNKYDAIIADYHLPGMTGLSLLKELKARGDTTPFIMLTGSGPEDIINEVLHAGATFYLRKGKHLEATISDLAHKIHLAVHQKRAHHNREIFSAISRHDLLNKVTALSGYVELVRANTEDRNILDYMIKQQMILGTIREQLQFIEDYEKIGVQKPSWQSLPMVVRKASALLPLDFITLSLVEIDDIELYADPLLLKVFYNLLDNTLRHGGKITSVRISAEKSDNGLLIVYEDDGVGIPAKEKESIFLRGKGKNTGLGLFLIREILSITGITIRENGLAGKGARFEIRVPEVRYRTR